MNVEEEFRNRFEREPDGVWRAPGRVNLIGDHTDYADGFVLPFAIDRETRVAVALRRDDTIRCRSIARGDAEPVALDQIAPRPGEWTSYVAGVAALLASRARHPRGFDMVVGSTVPAGAGLSSSAALSCATALALAELWETDATPLELATLARRAEREYAGVPCGVMDQVASIFGREGSALLIDTRSVTVTPLSFPPAGTEPLVIDTRVAHDVGEGTYAERLARTEEAAQVIGVRALRDATLEDLQRVESQLDPVTARRARHVVTENQRVLEAAEALREGDLQRLGSAMAASHASLRDDHEVSCRELDLVVEAALDHGAIGARMTGAGFGGSVICLVQSGSAQELTDGVLRAAADSGVPEPAFLPVVVSAGAGRLTT